MSRDRISPAQRCFAQASALLAGRWGGLRLPGEDWLCRDAVQALALPLDPRRQDALHVALHDGVNARLLPTRWCGLPLRIERAPRLQAQSRPPLLRLTRTREEGTATALVRDRLNGDRCYLLTCGHVVAPDSAARYGDEVALQLRGGIDLSGRLREWQPDVAPGNLPSTLDAALVELDAGSLQVLRQQSPDWLPLGLSDDVRPGQPVALQRVDSVLDGLLCQHWSGEVGAGGDTGGDYFLQDAIGYSTDSPTLGGDSGGAVWAEGDRLLGMHIGAIEGARAPRATAVMARVKPALDWFCVKPFTRNDPATLTPADWPAPPFPDRGQPSAAATAARDSQDRLVLAQTLWGEARGEGRGGMQAVAAVVLNRWHAQYRGCQTISAVCLDPKQFSCWNADDPNSALLTRVALAPDANFQDALAVADLALSGGLADPTRGARHYVATTLPDRLRPAWLLAKQPCVVIGRHEFYNDIC